MMVMITKTMTMLMTETMTMTVTMMMMMMSPIDPVLHTKTASAPARVNASEQVPICSAVVEVVSPTEGTVLGSATTSSPLPPRASTRLTIPFATEPKGAYHGSCRLGGSGGVDDGVIDEGGVLNGQACMACTSRAWTTIPVYWWTPHRTEARPAKRRLSTHDS
jgi:hypothetical protein